MSLFDDSKDLPDISADHPAGEDLEFDPAFAELERLAQGKPEQQFGSTVVPAEEPDWKLVIAGASTLMERTYDLRVTAHLGVARLHRDGVVAYAEVLALVRQMLRTRWDEIFPKLDPEDNNDPTTRANALLLLAQPVRVLRVLRIVPLARSTRAGSVTWRDLSYAAGTLEPPSGTTKMTNAVIAGVFRETDPALLASLRTAVNLAHASAIDIPAAFDDAAGHGTGPDFTDLIRLLGEMRTMLDNHAPAAVASDASPESEPSASEDPEIEAPAASGQPKAPPVMNIQTMGPPTNRLDALRMLDLVVEFYQRNEPSSPLPLLIGRARRLAEMGFMDILRDLAPDGITQVERIAGTTTGP